MTRIYNHLAEYNITGVLSQVVTFKRDNMIELMLSG